MNESLKDKVILVTGGAKRIGRSVALQLVAEGARVVVHYNESERQAREVSPDIVNANLESVTEIRAMFDDVASRFGRLDALVNNAGRFARIDPLKVEESDWDFIHSVNLKATFFCNQAAAKIMLQQDDGGRIVNLSSLGALKAWPLSSHYCASKAGVVMLTRALASAWAPKVSVNTVAPGVIPFDLRDETIDRFIANTPAGRAGTGDEVAEAVLFYLKSTRFITGQLTAVDGGLSLK